MSAAASLCVLGTLPFTLKSGFGASVIMSALCGKREGRQEAGSLCSRHVAASDIVQVLVTWKRECCRSVCLTRHVKASEVQSLEPENFPSQVPSVYKKKYL